MALLAGSHKGGCPRAASQGLLHWLAAVVLQSCSCSLLAAPPSVLGQLLAAVACVHARLIRRSWHHRLSCALAGIVVKQAKAEPSEEAQDASLYLHDGNAADTVKWLLSTQMAARR